MKPHDIRVLAVAALVDERTIRRYLRGEPIRDLTRRRIQAAETRLRGSSERAA